MTIEATIAPWHYDSFNRFLQQDLPILLAQRLPLTGYDATSTGEFSCQIRITVGEGPHAVTALFEDLPAVNPAGLTLCSDRDVLIVPRAEHENLDSAQVACVGEQLLEEITEQLGSAPETVEWDEDTLKSWLPFCDWFGECMTPGRSVHAQFLDNQNWLSRRVHLRRIVLREFDEVITSGQFGLVCPAECPEGPNLGRVFSVSMGAEIRDGRLQRVSDSPEAMLGLSVSMIPLVGYDDNNRVLMGANMMRQWLVPEQQEPALVQSGNEPNDPEFWCGRNLLTAFVSMGVDTFEDGLIISQSAAEKLRCVGPVEPGDKLSNRHGAKGVVSRILADAEMPQLPDGRSVELCVSFIGGHARLNHGQIREAVLGAVALAEGAPIVAAPFADADDEELRHRMVQAGLASDGMTRLRRGEDGPLLDRSATVGVVYWGHPNHRGRDKLRSFVNRPVRQRIGELEYLALKEAGAIEVIRDLYVTQNVKDGTGDSLLESLSAGETPSRRAPGFSALVEKSSALGIDIDPANGLTFQMRGEGDFDLELAEPVPHPLLPGHELKRLPRPSETVASGDLEEISTANARLLQLKSNEAASVLVDRSRAVLHNAVRRYMEDLIQPKDLRFESEVLLSGRGVIAPGADLNSGQVGLPEELAWSLFAPLLSGETDRESIDARSDDALEALNSQMRNRHVILLRGPAVLPTSLVALKPVITDGPVIRVPPMVLELIYGDFDGDQAVLMLPLSEEAQRDAGERLTVSGHLSRDPELLLPMVLPRHEALWGLADLSLSSEALGLVEENLGIRFSTPESLVTRESLQSDMRSLLTRLGPDSVVEILDRLTAIGFERAKQAGASIGCFVREGMSLPEPPDSDDPGVWLRYLAACEQKLLNRTDFDGNIGPQLLAVRSGARGHSAPLITLAATRGVLMDVSGIPVRIAPCISEGVSAMNFWTAAAGARKGLAAVLAEQRERVNERVPGTRGRTVLARAMDSDYPGIVLAEAALAGEEDPLSDLDSRLFVGSGNATEKR